MSQHISLKRTEQKVFASAFGDGLWDILIGCVVLMFAVAPFLSPSLGDFWSSAVFLPFWALAFLAAWLIRKHVVRPRIGVVRFGPWRKARLIRFLLVALVLYVISFVLGLFSALSFGALPGWVYPASFSLIVLSTFSLAAAFLRFTWLYVYGALIAFSPLAGQWLYVHLGVPHHGYPVAFGISAGLPLLVGLAKLIHLVRAYPISNHGPHPEETAGA
jgi:MFS family permease